MVCIVLQVVNNCLNPAWNQKFDFLVEDGLHDMLVLEVWDHDTFGKVRIINLGSFFILIAQYILG